jgi:hypothetical protein
MNRLYACLGPRIPETKNTFGLILTAIYLDIKDLLYVISNTVADMIKRKTSI